MAEELGNVTAPEAPPAPSPQWASVTVGYSTRLKLDMNDYSSWEAIRALYWGQVHADKPFERIEIVPWESEDAA